MDREIIILSASTQRSWFHLSGLDRKSDRWVRICSRYSRAHGAIPFEQLIYSDFTPVRLFDVVKLRFVHSEAYFEQPERCRYDASYCWQCLDHLTLTDVIALHGFDRREFVFYNQDRRVSKDELSALKERESLLLMYVTDLNVDVQASYNRKQLSLSFECDGKKYSRFAIGDLRVRNYYMKKSSGLYHFADEAAVVFSLSTKYIDGNYYKVAAQILRWN